MTEDTEMGKAISSVPEDTFRAYMRQCKERGEQATPAGLLDFAGVHNPVASVERAFISALERRYPGTRWSRTSDVGDQGGAVRRTLVAQDDPEALGHRLAPTLGRADDDGGEQRG